MTTHPLWLPFAPGANAARQGQRIAVRQTAPGAVRPHDRAWRDDYRRVRDIVVTALEEQTLAIRHIGSTSIAGADAKPVIDVDLTVADAEDEPRYLPRLESAGFRLLFRDRMAGDPHRHLTLAIPNTNLHVWSPGALEPRRHALFVDRLRSHAEERRVYNAAKAAAVGAAASGRYNDLKAAVVYDIYERAFIADPDHRHDPQPRQQNDAARPTRMVGRAAGGDGA